MLAVVSSYSDWCPTVFVECAKKIDNIFVITQVSAEQKEGEYICQIWVSRGQCILLIGRSLVRNKERGGGLVKT